MKCKFCGNDFIDNKSFCRDCVPYESGMAARIELGEAIDDLKHQVWHLIETKIMWCLDKLLRALRFMRVL